MSSQSSEGDMGKWLQLLGCKRRDKLFVLDEFDSEFFLVFDTSYDPEEPESLNTCDILVQSAGVSPKESDGKYRVIANARRFHVLRFMFALGVSRFGEKTQKFLYGQNGVIRT